MRIMRHTVASGTQKKICMLILPLGQAGSVAQRKGRCPGG